MKKPVIIKKSKGVAILTVMISLALMMAIVTELSTTEIVRYKLAINERDALQAEALAESGANFAKLILMVQEPLQAYMSNFASMGISMPAYTVWELMPIDSDLLKGITNGSFLPSFDFGSSGEDGANKAASENNAEKDSVREDTAKEVALYGPYQSPDGGYGGFAGRFSTEIEDEEKKISLRRWPKIPSLPKRKMVADLLLRFLLKPENEILFDGSTGNTRNITPQQLVGNIYDYLSEEDFAVDVTAAKENWGREGSGDKKSIYIDSPGILPKRAPLDSIAELRLVPGMTDAIFQELSKHVTVYGENEKINILSASDDMLGAAFYICTKDRENSRFSELGFEENLLAEWRRKKAEGEFALTVDGLIAHLEENRIEVDKEECGKFVGNESKTFTVKSTATVGTVTKTLIMRLRSAGGITTLYQFQYL